MNSSRGIDLNDPDTLKLIRRIFYARFAGSLPRIGIDPDDALQEVLLGFMGRNGGTNPFNPEVSSPSNYIYTVIQSVIRNMIDSTRRSVRRNGDLGGKDDVAIWDSGSTSALASASLDLRDRARELDVPEGFLLRVAEGQDPWAAAEEEVGFFDAMFLMDRLKRPV